MKTNIIKYTLLLLMSFVISITYSQDNFSKKYEKTFTVNENSLFKLSNKYGEVHIETNTSDKVEIIVSVDVEAKSKEKADEMFKKVNIKFDESGNTISATTEIDGSIKETSINYKVKMPETLQIELFNKYGFTFIDKLKSNSIIIVKYGKLQINELLTSELENKAVVQIKYSEGTIDKCDYLDLDVKYSEMEVNESRVVNLNSGYSKMNFDKAYILKAISKYDPGFTVNEATKLVLEGKYSAYDIGKLHSSLKGVIKYSNLRVETLMTGFENVFVSSKYGNVKIYTDEDASYKLNAKTEYGSITCKGKVIETDHGNTEVSSSFVGNDKDSTSKITIAAEYGNVTVK